jgi:VWFA-related protein
MAQGKQDQRNTPTFRATSTLVFLDITVLDKKGQPVVTGLTRDDFGITEDKKPQSIFSFEAPETHVTGPNAEDSDPDGMAPVTIFVLDLLNSSFEDFGYIRYEVRRFLMTQPPQLTSPAELMVNGNNSLDMLQGYTRSRADLLYALDHLPAVLPWKQMIGSFFWDLFDQSMNALQLIALQNRGVPGRKNIIWVGRGGPGIFLDRANMSVKTVDRLRQYLHSTTNMLVDARISLFVLYPGLPGGLQHLPQPAFQSPATISAHAEIGDDDPFAGDINFGVFVNETGGKLFYNRNDLDTEIKQSERIGSEYYTLTYQPQDVEADGKFRRIRVTLRDRSLRAVTKAGYFAPDKNMPIDAQQAKVTNLANAAQSSIPFNALDVSLFDVVRHPDSGTAEFTVQLKSKNVTFLPTDDGKRTANLILAAASLNKDKRFLASRIHTLTLLTQDMRPLPEVVSSFQLTIPVPRKTRRVRVVIQNEDGGRIGTADLDRETIEAAPAIPTPEPELVTRPEQAPTPDLQRR